MLNFSSPTLKIFISHFEIFSGPPPDVSSNSEIFVSFSEISNYTLHQQPTLRANKIF